MYRPSINQEVILHLTTFHRLVEEATNLALLRKNRKGEMDRNIRARISS